MRGEQHPVLEGAGLALVGIADHVTRGAWGIAAGLPLQAGGEAGAAAAAQIGRLISSSVARDPEAAVPMDSRRERASAAGSVRAPRSMAARSASPGCSAWPKRMSARRMLSSMVNSSEGQSSSGRCSRIRPAISIQALAGDARDGPTVDQQAGPLVTQAGAGGEVDGDQTLLGQVSPLHPEPGAQVFQQILVAAHAVGDVVGEQHAVAAHRPQVKKTVKPRHPLDSRARHVEAAGQSGQRRGRRSSRELPEPRAGSAPAGWHRVHGAPAGYPGCPG